MCSFSRAVVVVVVAAAAAADRQPASTAPHTHLRTYALRFTLPDFSTMPILPRHASPLFFKTSRALGRARSSCPPCMFCCLLPSSPVLLRCFIVLVIPPSQTHSHTLPPLLPRPVLVLVLLSSRVSSCLSASSGAASPWLLLCLFFLFSCSAARFRLLPCCSVALFPPPPTHSHALLPFASPPLLALFLLSSLVSSCLSASSVAASSWLLLWLFFSSFPVRSCSALVLSGRGPRERCKCAALL